MSSKAQLSRTTNVTELEALLDTEAVAKIIGRSPRTLESERVQQTGIPYVKIGALVRYRPSDVAAYIASHVVTPTTSIPLRVRQI